MLIVLKFIKNKIRVIKYLYYLCALINNRGREPQIINYYASKN